MKFAKSNKMPGRSPETEARVEALLAGDETGEPMLGKGPIVLMTRVRLARNLSRSASPVGPKKRNAVPFWRNACRRCRHCHR